MRRRLFRVVLLCLALGNALARFNAATAQTLQTVSLEDAVAAAVDRHPSIVAAANALEAAEARLRQARGGAALQVSINGKASVGTLAVGGPTGGAPTASHNLSVEGSLALVDGGILALQIVQAEAGVQAARAALDAVRQDTALAAAQAYMQVLRALRVVEVREAALRSAQLQVQQAEALVRAGTAARADIVKAQAVAANAEADLIASRGQVEITLAGLRSAMGMPLTQTVAVVDPGDPTPLALGPTEAAVEAAAQRAEVRRAGADIRAAGAALRLAELRTAPLVSVGANGVVQVTPTPGQAGWSVSATISFPLVDGGKTTAAVDEARANLAAARARADATVQQVQLQAYQAAVSMRETIVRGQALRVSLAASQESLRVVEGRYRAGVAILLELLEAQTAATQAQMNSVQAQYDLRVAVITLRHAAGRPIVERRSAQGAAA